MCKYSLQSLNTEQNPLQYLTIHTCQRLTESSVVARKPSARGVARQIRHPPPGVPDMDPFQWTTPASESVEKTYLGTVESSEAKPVHF